MLCVFVAKGQNIKGKRKINQKIVKGKFVQILILYSYPYPYFRFIIFTYNYMTLILRLKWI